MPSIEEIRLAMSNKISEYEKLDFETFANAMVTNGVISFTQLTKIKQKKFPGTNSQRMFELIYLIKTLSLSEERLTAGLQDALNKLKRPDLLDSTGINPIETSGSGAGGSANGASIAADPNSCVTQPEVVTASDELAAAYVKISSLEADNLKYKNDSKLQKLEMKVLDVENIRLKEIMILKDQLLAAKDSEIEKLKSINEGVWGVTQSPPSDQGKDNGGNAHSSKNTQPS